MRKSTMRNLIMLANCALFAIFFAACSTSGSAVIASGHPKIGHGPPSHAPAHGYRAKHNYRYYPNVQVYFDVSERVYFYQKGDRWCVSASLPDRIEMKLGHYVTIAMDSDTPPYRYAANHKRKYPPGQKKKWK